MSIRLNQNHRASLRDLAERIVDVPAETKAEEAAYQKVRPYITELVEAQFPPADMKVMAKYDRSTRKDRCINIRLDAGGDERFEFREGEEPTVPNNGGCHGRFYLASDRVSKLLTAWVSAKDARNKALKEKLGKYVTFINTAVTYEQVLEIWPEAAEVSDRITRNLPVAINEEVIDEIKRDSARRMRRAA